MPQIFIILSLTLSIPNSITITANIKMHKKVLNYEGIPYKFFTCHSYGHVGEDFPSGELKKK